MKIEVHNPIIHHAKIDDRKFIRIAKTAQRIYFWGPILLCTYLLRKMSGPSPCHKHIRVHSLGED